MAELNKIEFISVKSEDDGKASEQCIRKRIYAKTYGIHFLIDLEMNESDASIKMLKIKINDATRRELEAFFER